MKTKSFAKNCFGIAVWIAVSIPALLSAQDSTATRSKFSRFFEDRYIPMFDDTIKPYGKNEIAVNIAPVVSTLLGGFPNNEARFSVYYKRQIHDSRNHLRFGFMYRPETQYAFWQSADEMITSTGDSTRIRTSMTDNGKRPFQLSFGIKRRAKVSKRLSGYLSADLFYGVYFRRYSLVDFSEKMNTDGTWEYNDDPSAQSILINDQKTSFNWMAGISPNAGLRYAITNRFFMSAQIGFEFYLSGGTRYEMSRWGYDLEPFSQSSFNFSTNALINEFALAYRF